MKNTVFFIGLSLFSFFCLTPNIQAQVDSKYLKGAVPEVRGKVVFSDTIPLQSVNQNRVYERALMWAEANFNTEENRVTYINQEKGIVACKGKAELVFSSSALSLDRTFMNYLLIIQSADNSCWYELKAISYDYNTSGKKTPEKYLAEEWITDKEAVNKNKLYRLNGKFRIKTIDWVDDIYNSLAISLNTGEVDLFTNKEKANHYSRQNQDKTSLPDVAKNPDQPLPQPASEKVVAVPASFDQTAKEASAVLVVNKQIAPPPLSPNEPSKPIEVPSDMQGFKHLDADKIPGNIIKLLSNDWMLITAGRHSEFDMSTTGWGGLGVLFGKPTAFCFVDAALPISNRLMETGSTYTLSFYTETYRESLRYCATESTKNGVEKAKASGLTPITLPSGSQSFSEAWMIIECKKLLDQPLSIENRTDDKIKQELGQSQLYKMFAGEILNVWVK